MRLIFSLYWVILYIYLLYQYIMIIQYYIIITLHLSFFRSYVHNPILFTVQLILSVESHYIIL